MLLVFTKQINPLLMSLEKETQDSDETMEVDIDLSALEIQTYEEGSSKAPKSLLQNDSKSAEVDYLRRSGRKKFKPLENPEKRRVVTRPRKLNTNSSIKDIESYYLDKKVKVFSPALETIFEEPKKDILMGTRRLRRCINFTEIVSEKPDKSKVKKRSMKAKKLNKVKKFGKKIGLELLMKKLQDLESDDS